MNVLGVAVNCPYHVNKKKYRQLGLKVFLGGKGASCEIKQELVRLIKTKTDQNFRLTPNNIIKLAKRERVGIDCSGFAYRFLDELVKLKYKNTTIDHLLKIFPAGIYRTNAE